MSFEINRVYTDNPYVDELVYYTKQLALGTVLKLKDEADNNETAESLKKGSLYISCIEGTAIFEQFDITETALKSIGIVDTVTVTRYMSNKANIPVGYRARLTQALIEEFIANYEELNPYYRMLHGLPKIGQEDYVDDWIPPADDIKIDLSKPIHEMDDTEAQILDQYGVLDGLIEEDPKNRQYMKYLGKKKIDYYLARRANRFDTLYIPTIDSDSIYKMYRERLDENKHYALRAVYSNAFKYDSDYYDNFIAIFIVIITMVDLISRVQEFITRKEIFDIRSVQYIFKSYGVPFYEEIPLKYQIAMVQNLHTLLKYKSTAKCMVDICSLFGFSNIKIFKYYLLKDRKIDPNSDEFVYAVNEEGVEDLTKEFELKFLKMPLDADLDDYIKSTTNYVDYDEITELDPKWDGGLQHQDVINAILKEEFNFTRTKYMSIDTLYEIAKMSAQQSYFFNFLYDNVDLESLLTVKIPYISANKSFLVADVFTLLTALTHKYNGAEDIILNTQSQILYVNGFNFKADLATLWNDIRNKYIYEIEGHENASDIPENSIIKYPSSTLHAQEQLQKFIQPTSSIPTFNEMMDIFVNNMEVRDELIKGMREADNKAIYDVYKKLYDSLMTVQLTNDYYKNPETGDFYRNSDGDPTYTEFLKHKDPTLYAVILQIDEFEDQSSRNQYIANLIDSIVYALEEFIDTEEFQSLFANLPIMSSEAVKQYIATIINFYKSYKIDFLGINTIYTLDDYNDGSIRLIDKVAFLRRFERVESLNIRETIKALVNKKEKTRLSFVERMYMDIYTWLYRTHKDGIKLRDNIDTFMYSMTYLSQLGDRFISEDSGRISSGDNLIPNSNESWTNYFSDSGEVNMSSIFGRELLTKDLYLTYSEFVNLLSDAEFITKYNPEEDLGVLDRIWISTFYE